MYHSWKNWKRVHWSCCVLNQMKSPGWEEFQLWVRNLCPLKLMEKALKSVTVGNAFNFMESTMAAWWKKCLSWPWGWPMGQFCCCFSFFLPLPNYWLPGALSLGTSLPPSASLLVSCRLKWELIDVANKTLRDTLSIQVIWPQSEMPCESVSGSKTKKNSFYRMTIFLWPPHTPCEILVLDQGSNPWPLQ